MFLPMTGLVGKNNPQTERGTNMKELRNIKDFELEVYSDANGRLRYNGKAWIKDTHEPVTFYYKTKRNGYYNKVNKGENFESLKNRLYTCDYYIKNNCDYYIKNITVYITR